MNPDDIERQLQRRVLRTAPEEWRSAILSAAYEARAEQMAADSASAERRKPRYAGWAALAAVWLAIAGIHAMNTLREPVLSGAKAASSSHEWTRHWSEQRRILAESEPHPSVSEPSRFIPAAPKSGSRVRVVRASLPV